MTDKDDSAQIPMEEGAAPNDEDRELATAPIPHLVAKYSRITMQGMIAQIIMVVIEGFIMGTGLGAHGLACVGVIMSVEYINLSFGQLFGTGVPTVVGNLLGAGDHDGAQKAFSQGFWLSLYVGLILLVIFEVFTTALANFFGATPDILEDSVAGIRTFGILLPCTVVGQMLTAVMLVIEKPQQSANIMTISAVIAAAWLALSTFVFGFGVAGAGIYYGLSIGLYMLGVYYFVGHHSELQIRVSDMKLDWKVCGQIIKIGTPFFVVELGTFVYNTVANNLLGMFGGADASLYIAAFAVISGYVIYIIMMVAQAFSLGMQPIAAFNAGAKAWERLKQSFKSALKLEIIVIAIITVIIWLAAYPICDFFCGGDALLSGISADATRIAILASCLGFTSMVMSTYFQAVDRILLSTILGISRYVIFACPLMYLMGSAMGINGIWWALVVADILTGVVSFASGAGETKRLNKLIAA
jgi:Na+-driven multidrug efflux pump